MKIRFTIPGAPRSAKNSPVLRWGTGKRGQPIPAMSPSPYYKAWFDEAMSYAPVITAKLRESIGLPIPHPVNVAAIFYRENATVADVVAYYQALGDWLQMPNERRNGAGIIVDDSQIESWDGSRRRIDRIAPRIEVTITTLEEGQQDLFDSMKYVYQNVRQGE